MVVVKPVPSAEIGELRSSVDQQLAEVVSALNENRDVVVNLAAIDDSLGRKVDETADRIIGAFSTAQRTMVIGLGVIVAVGLLTLVAVVVR